MPPRRRHQPQHTSPESVARLERNERAIELRRQGKTYLEIGRELGISRMRAHQIITAEMTKRREKFQDKADSLIQMQLDRLELLWNRLQGRIDMGEPRACEVGIAILRRQAELMGLDQPIKVHNTHELIELSDDELRQEAERLRIDVQRIEIPALLPGEAPATAPPEIIDAEIVGPALSTDSLLGD